MKKIILSLMLAVVMLFGSINCMAAFPVWESPRYIPEDEARTPWTEEGNPFVTYYAPWLRNFHIMTAEEAENNKAAGIVGGEACQQIRQVAISPVNPDVMYLCSDTSGVHKTTTGGKHWYSCTNNAAGHDAKGLLCDIFDENTVFVYMRKTGVHRSKDGGYTWEQIIADTDQTQNVGRRSSTIVQDASGNTYMAVGSGIYKLDRATDTLTNLTKKQFPALAALTGNNSAEFLDMSVSGDGRYIYACCTMAMEGTDVTTGLYVSENGGESWTIYNSSPDSAYGYTNIRTVAIDPENDKKIYVGMRLSETDSSTGETVAGDYNLYVSEDAGKNFSFVYRPQNLSGGNVVFYGLKFGPKNASGIYPMYLHVEKTIYPLRVSFNYTEASPKFSQVYTKNSKLGAGTIREGYTGYLYQAFQPDMTTEGTNDIRVIFAASGMYEYTGKYDPETKAVSDPVVKRISSGYSGASMEDMAFDSQYRIFAPVVDVGSYHSNGTVYDKDTYPTFLEGGGMKYGKRAIFDPNDDNHVIVYVGTSNGYGTYSGIKQSYDGGKKFNDFNEDAKLFTVKPADEEESEEDLGNSGGEETEDDESDTSLKDWATYGNAQVLCYDKLDENIIYSSYHNSYDNGETWVKNEYFILDVHPTNTRLQVGIKKEGSIVTLYKTTDGGETWNKVLVLTSESVFSKFRNFKDVDFDLNDPNYIWFIHYNTFGRINLATHNVENYNSKFEYQAYTNVEINPKNPEHMLLTSSPGTHVSIMKKDFKLAESYDNGETWHVVPGLWGTAFNNIIFSPNTNEAFITGHRGTLIYDYEKFNYYAATKLTYKDVVKTVTLKRVNEDGENVNNGKYIVAPEDVFYPRGKILQGWEYNGETYEPGDNIAISE